MYRQTNTPDSMKAAKCNQCGSSSLLYGKGKLVCRNCDHVIGKTGFNKYGAKRTEFNGKNYDSKFEASVAAELELRKTAGDIKDYDTQYKVECEAYTKDGDHAFTIKHKVDFRIHHNDGSYELHEAKGIETADYKFRRKCLEELWLPLHKDHIYTVIKQNVRKR